jgi:hypothetical protein
LRHGYNDLRHGHNADYGKTPAQPDTGKMTAEEAESLDHDMAPAVSLILVPTLQPG